jgi:lysophospholipase L1-like esterase
VLDKRAALGVAKDEETMIMNIPNRARRRTLLTGLLAGAWCLASGLLPAGSTTAAAAEVPTIGTVAVLGDSYSVTTRSGVKGWVQQLVDRNAVSVVTNAAKEGAFASSASGPLSLLGQVDAVLAKPRADFTIVYFGTDDLVALKSQATVRANYQRAVDRLVAGGATAGTRRLILVQVHDVSRNPGVTTDERAKVTSLNAFIKKISRARPHIFTVNLGALFDRVFADPADVGFTNVTTADPARSATTALYFDANHFGKRGQTLIANEVAKVLRNAG